MPPSPEPRPPHAVARGGAGAPQIILTDEKAEAQSNEGAAKGSRPWTAQGAEGWTASRVTESGSQRRKRWGWQKDPHVLSRRFIKCTQDSGRKGQTEPKLPCEAKPLPNVCRSFWSGKVRARALWRPSWRRRLNKHWIARDSCENSPETTLGLASTTRAGVALHRRGFPGTRDP